jgi:hypothetical protein
MLKIEEDEAINNYLELFQEITDTSQRKRLIQPLEVFYTSLVAVQAEGNPPLKFKKSVITEALKEGILEMTQNDKYDVNLLLNERSMKTFKKLFSSSELKELKYFLVNVRNNLSKTIERLPN